jgi:hypothetical protein
MQGYVHTFRFGYCVIVCKAVGAMQSAYEQCIHQNLGPSLRELCLHYRACPRACVEGGTYVIHVGWDRLIGQKGSSKGSIGGKAVGVDSRLLSQEWTS